MNELNEIMVQRGEWVETEETEKTKKTENRSLQCKPLILHRFLSHDIDGHSVRSLWSASANLSNYIPLYKMISNW